MLTTTQEGCIINVSNTTHKGVRNIMKHPTYYDLIYLMDTRNISFQTLANSLKLSFNEFVDKIIGKDDFTLSEGQLIAMLLGESLDVIFFTSACVDEDTKETKLSYTKVCYGRM